MRKPGFALFLIPVILLLLSAPLHAGGPLDLCSPGQPLIWPGGGVGIAFNSDQGGLGTMGNADAVAQTEAAFAQWAGVASATATYFNAGQLPVDVDETNFTPYIFGASPDGLNAVVYDEDGALFDLLFGAGSGILGMASPQWFDPVTCEIIEAVALFNGAVIGPGGIPAADFLSVQVHEFGHYSGLAHTVVNGQIVFGDATGPSPDSSIFPPESLFQRIETMYPFNFVGGGQETPAADDVASLSTLYPAPGFFSSTGSIEGIILRGDGITPVTGVNVIARNLASPFDDAVSAVSGHFGFPGRYQLQGLTAGGSYAVFIDGIQFGAFSTPVIAPLPGPEEFYNGAAESNNGIAADDPLDWTPLLSLAGQTTAGVDIVFNFPSPGEPLDVGDDGSVELPLPFPLELCGQDLSSVFVNANGNLTFGSSRETLVETAAGFLAGPPSVAALFDDLNPLAGGEVSFDTDGKKYLTVFYQGIPEFPSSGSNSFSITLESQRILIDYGAISAGDGLAGVSCGGAITSGFEGEIDLSATGFKNGKARKIELQDPAAYEIFSAADNDLSGLALQFGADGSFPDALESGSDPVTASKVRLPFDSGNDFTAIDPAGNDVDFFRLEKLQAGTRIEVEVVAGQLDSYLGIFQIHGAGSHVTVTLLAADDDGGVGLLSRILFTVPADGDYAVGVTTFDDFDFSGDGSSSGRYVLSIQPVP